MCLAMCLKFPEFEAGSAYKLVAYEKKTCTRCLKFECGHIMHQPNTENEKEDEKERVTTGNLDTVFSASCAPPFFFNQKKKWSL